MYSELIHLFCQLTVPQGQRQQQHKNGVNKHGTVRGGGDGTGGTGHGGHTPSQPGHTAVTGSCPTTPSTPSAALAQPPSRNCSWKYTVAQAGPSVAPRSRASLSATTVRALPPHPLSPAAAMAATALTRPRGLAPPANIGLAPFPPRALIGCASLAYREAESDWLSGSPSEERAVTCPPGEMHAGRCSRPSHGFAFLGLAGYAQAWARQGEGATLRGANARTGCWGVPVSRIRPGLREPLPPPPQAGPSRMAAIARAQMAPAGRGQVRRPLSSRPQRQPPSVCVWAAAGPEPVFQPPVGRAHTGEREEGTRHRLGRRTGPWGAGVSARSGELNWAVRL